jgi:diadenosine tetraphosphate (Ap4A) HIT family hydrolase
MTTSIQAAPSSIRRAEAAAPVAAATGKFTAAAIIATWKKATLQATVTAIAREQLRPQYDAAIQKQEKRFHHELTDDEKEIIVDRVNDKLLDGQRKQVMATVANDPAAQAKLINGAVANLKEHLGELKNPFKALARGSEEARKKERIVWEDRHVMVLVDLFADSPKVLVVPKASAATPLDVAPRVLDEVGKLAQASAQAFTRIAKAKPADAWVNPPQYLSVAQLHMHVQPNLKPLRASQENRFWASFAKELRATVGKSIDGTRHR